MSREVIENKALGTGVEVRTFPHEFDIKRMKTVVHEKTPPGHRVFARWVKSYPGAAEADQLHIGEEPIPVDELPAGASRPSADSDGLDGKTLAELKTLAGLEGIETKNRQRGELIAEIRDQRKQQVAAT